MSSSQVLTCRFFLVAFRLATIQKAAKARASSLSALDIVISTEDLSSIPDRVEAKGNITILDEILDQAYLSSLLDRV